MRYERRACSAMMYTKDQPKIYINDCLVHNMRHPRDGGDMRHTRDNMEEMEMIETVERENMFKIQAIRRERSASLPSADISVYKMQLFLILNFTFRSLRI